MAKPTPLICAVLAALGLGFGIGVVPTALAQGSSRATTANYWLLSSTGQVFAYGKARNYGSEYHKKFKGTITAIKGTKNGKGYWIVTSKTHYSFGNADRYKYAKGGTSKYTGKLKPKGLHGKVIGIAAAKLATVTKTTTTLTTTTPVKTTTTTTTTTTPSGPNCSGVAIDLSPSNHVITHQSAYFSMSLPVTGPDGTWTWNVSPGTTPNSTDLPTLPAGLNLTNGSIIGTPTTDGQAGWVTLTATDSTCPSDPVTVQQFFVVQDPSMTITTGSLASGQAGSSYSQSVTATGGEGTNYNWSATGLPGGLSINSGTGVISGTPSASDATSGPQAYSVNVTVSDPDGEVPSVSRGYTVTISPVALTFVTNTLTAVEGQSYSGSVVMSGGVAPYHLSLAVGSNMPTGLNFSDGTITGTPTAGSGSYTFTVDAYDSQSVPYETSETFDMEIAPAADSPDTSVTGSNSNAIWDGYVEQGSGSFTSASATMTVPTLANAAFDNEVSPWVGVGGYCNCNLLQAGVTAYSNSSNGQLTYTGWWEDYPANSPQDLVTVNPGDTVVVYLWQVSSGEWEITLNDLTSGAGFQVEEAYSGDTSTAEWIDEIAGGQGAVGYTSTSTFSHLTASQTGTGVVEQTDPGGNPGSLSGAGFTVNTGY